MGLTKSKPTPNMTTIDEFGQHNSLISPEEASLKGPIWYPSSNGVNGINPKDLTDITVRFSNGRTSYLDRIPRPAAESAPHVIITLNNFSAFVFVCAHTSHGGELTAVCVSVHER